MIRSAGVVLALSTVAFGAQPACAPAVRPSGATPTTETVHVASPTGESALDRASILAALEQARPGGTVQFAAGTYLVGEIVPIQTARITLLGHPDGTTVRGCDPAAYEQMEGDAAAAGDDWRARFAAVRRCGTFELMGGHATVRGFTFEYTRMGLMLGCCHAEREQRPTEGGYLIERNTFRDSGNGIRPGLLSAEPTVIRGNRFINTFHAISAAGGHLHILDNDISVPEPERVPGVGHPSFAISFCGDHNLVAGNRIEGHPDGIVMYAWGEGCRHNVIRDNTIAVRRVPLPGTRPYPDLARVTDVADSTIVGVPLLLINERGEAPLEDNLIEGNRFLGAEGIAVELSGGTRNRIVNNTFSAIRVRDPFPGNGLGSPPAWEVANGSAIWVSPGSDQNEIRDNTFEDIAAYAVVVQGNRNRIETNTPADTVRDLGSGNDVSLRASGDEITGLTARYVEFLNDEWSGGASNLFAPDATMSLGDGIILEGRDAIIRDFFRPTVARIRGLVPTSTKVVDGEREVTVVTAFKARFAPAPDTVRGSFSNRWAQQPDGSWLIAAATFELPGWQDDGTSAPGIRSGFFEADGLRLHFLDSGGDGVPLLFMPVRDRTAYSFIEFAGRFTERHRVLAITSRGTGQSGGELDDLFSVANAARDVVALLDALRIERAVVVPAWSADIGIILANLHPDRLAGLIFAGGPPAPGQFELWDADSTGMLAMAPRLYFSVDGIDPDEGMRRMRAQHEEGARHRRIDGPIRVPALAFVAESGTADVEHRWEADLRLARWVADDPGMFGDSVSREFYLKLASDEQLQDSVRALYRDFVAPRYRAVEQAFSTAFGSGLRLVPVEAQRIGYAYRDAPDMIYPHIRRFLDDVSERERRSVSTGADTIHVAPPTGERAADRASILAAVEQVRPGGTILFASGMYTVGEIVPVTIPDITFLGHPDGTVLRGCDPADYREMEREAVRLFQSPDVEPRATWALLSRCGMLELTGGRVTIRNLTFEYSRLGIVLGCCGADDAFRPTAGGYLIEGNTFRNSGNSIRARLSSPDATVIRNNRFVNTFHALSAIGSRLHFIDNHLSVPQPTDIPGGHPGFGISIGGIPPQLDPAPPAGSCDDNVIAGNHVEGHPNGIFLGAYGGVTCTGSVIRDNTIIVRRGRFQADWPYAVFVPLNHPSDSTFVGVPLTLWGDPDDNGAGGFLMETLIEGNRILGAEGVGLELTRAQRTRIVNNTIRGVARREPYPGNVDGPAPGWGVEYNGSAIWVSAGSNDNEIIGNVFDDVASHAVILAGDRNRVETRSAGDAVRDLGNDNRVTRRAAESLLPVLIGRHPDRREQQ